MKIQKTFTIEEEVWDKFNKVANAKSYNKSLLIENHMRDIIYLSENPEYFISYGDVKILRYVTDSGVTYTVKEKEAKQIIKNV